MPDEILKDVGPVGENPDVATDAPDPVYNEAQIREQLGYRLGQVAITNPG